MRAGSLTWLTGRLIECNRCLYLLVPVYEPSDCTVQVQLPFKFGV